MEFQETISKRCFARAKNPGAHFPAGSTAIRRNVSGGSVPLISSRRKTRAADLEMNFFRPRELPGVNQFRFLRRGNRSIVPTDRETRPFAEAFCNFTAAQDRDSAAASFSFGTRVDDAISVSCGSMLHSDHLFICNLLSAAGRTSINLCRSRPGAEHRVDQDS